MRTGKSMVLTTILWEESVLLLFSCLLLKRAERQPSRRHLKATGQIQLKHRAKKDFRSVLGAT